ncbi:hypothetical protein [Cupriavidus pauculus]|uniref:hypothetical protein n=1 Tax=Cupriavidus pauculus TaxID=82633 RepID=UPI0038576260
MKLTRFSMKATATAALMTMLSACAVSQQDIRDAEQGAKNQIAKAQANSDARLKDAPLIEYVDANYLGGEPMALTNVTTLPPVFRERKVRLLATDNLKAHADVVAKVLGIPVRINPDVWNRPMPRRSMGTSGQAAVAGGVNPTASPQPSSAGMPPGNPMAAPTPQSIALSAFTNYADPEKVAMDFVGNGEQTMDALTRPLGLSWEYSREDNVMTIYRYYTKTYRIRTGSGTTKTAGTVDKGTSTGSGAAGGGGGNGGGASTGATFNAANSTNTTDTLAPLASILATIKKNYLSADGEATDNSATASITVTDSRYVVDQITKYIDTENAMLGKQVAVTVQKATYQIDNNAENGLDLGPVFSKLAGDAAEWTLKLSSPSTLVSQTAGAMSFNVLSPTSRWNGTTVNLQSLNGYGKTIVSDVRTLVTKNRVPTTKFELDSQEYVNRTTPGTATLSGSSTVGLEQTTVTTGNLLTITPTIYDSNTVELSVAMDDSTLLPFDETTAGQGATAQRVKSAHTRGDVGRSVIEIRDGESLVLVGVNSDKTSSTNRWSFSGGSVGASKTKVMSVIVITPKILEGS